MPFVLWTFLSLFAYIAGLVIILRVTPMLFSRAYDEGLFMGIAAADVIGGMLAFGAVAITFGIFSGSFAIRVLDFLLLIGILVVGIQLSMRSFRPRFSIGTTYRTSRIIAGCYCVFLLVAALFYLALLFTPG